MNIAYLIHYTGTNYEELSENIDQILDAGDSAFVMINDDKLRDDIFIAYGSIPECHVASQQASALYGDLSLPRGTIMQMKEAFELEEDYDDIHYDYFINLTDGMMLTVSKEKMDAYLEKLDGRDSYYVVADSDTNPELKKRFEEYAFFTNSLAFQKSKMLQGMNSFTKTIVKNFKKREMEDTIVQTWPWFILSRDSARKLVDNLAYCSSQFMMCLYPEELAFGTMLKKFGAKPPVSEKLWLTGQGDYQSQARIKPVTMEQLCEHPEVMFAGLVSAKDNLTVYQDIFDVYCPNKEQQS